MELPEAEIHSPPERKQKIDGESKENGGSGSSGSKESAMLTDSKESSDSEDSDISPECKPSVVLEEMKGVKVWKVEDGDYSTDEETYTYADEDAEKYLQQIKETEGYEVNYYKGIGQQGGIQPSRMPLMGWEIEFYTEIVEHAMRVYDEKNETNLKLVEITQLNCECGGLIRSYLTFRAKNGNDGDVKIYQTRARIFPGGEEIEEVRLKPGVN